MNMPETSSAPAQADIDAASAAPGREQIVEDVIAKASRDELISLLREIVSITVGERRGLEELVRLAVDCGRKSVASEQRMFKAVSTAVDGLNLAHSLHDRSKRKAAFDVVEVVRAFLNEIVKIGCIAVPYPELSQCPGSSEGGSALIDPAVQ